MRTFIRRLLLVFCALRYGVRLIWLAAPKDDMDGTAAFIARMHASSGARARLHRALPHLGPLASAFAESVAEHPELAERTLHDALDAAGRLEAPLPPQQSEHALAGAFGRPLAEVFASIDLVPFHSGVAEQTHGARLAAPAGAHRDVSIKLLRVRQVENLADDAALLVWAARLVEKFSKAARELQLHALAESFAADLMRRFDLRAEAASLSQTGRHFEGDARLVVPGVVWELCTDSALVTQRIATLPATDLEALRMHHVNLPRLATHIIEVVAQQTFEHGFFHGAFDARHLHVSVEPDTLGRIVLADFSIMASLSEQEREFFVHGAAALFERDYGRLADMHRDAGYVSGDVRAEKLEAELRVRGEAHFAAPQHERSASGLLRHLFEAVQPLGGTAPQRLAAAHRALAQAESLAQALHPGLDTWSVVETSLVSMARKDVDHRGWIKRIAQELPHLAPIVPRIPRLVMHRLMRQDERDALEASAWLQELQREYRRTRRLLWACMVCGALLGAGAVWLAR